MLVDMKNAFVMGFLFHALFLSKFFWAVNFNLLDARKSNLANFQASLYVLFLFFSFRVAVLSVLETLKCPNICLFVDCCCLSVCLSVCLSRSFNK